MFMLAKLVLEVILAALNFAIVLLEMANKLM